MPFIRFCHKKKSNVLCDFRQLFFRKRRMRWKPDRRPIAVVRGYNGDHKNHTWGLAKPWREGGVPWLVEELERLFVKGYRRFMISLPAGREKPPEGEKIPWPSAQWHVLDNAGIHAPSCSVRQDFAELLTPWLKERPDAHALLYQGFQVASPYCRDMSLRRVPGLHSEKDTGVIYQNTAGWLNLSPCNRAPQIGFAFDNSSIPENQHVLVELAKTFRVWGIRVVGEAIPLTPDNRKPKWDLIKAAPWFGLLQFYRRFDKEKGRLIGVDVDGTWRFDPTRTEIGVGIHEKLPFSDKTAEEVIRDFHARGFVFYVYGRGHDDMVLETTGAS
jgi:hypothetical protein